MLVSSATLLIYARGIRRGLKQLTQRTTLRTLFGSGHPPTDVSEDESDAPMAPRDPHEVLPGNREDIQRPVGHRGDGGIFDPIRGGGQSLPSIDTDPMSSTNAEHLPARPEGHTGSPREGHSSTDVPGDNPMRDRAAGALTLRPLICACRQEVGMQMLMLLMYPCRQELGIQIPMLLTYPCDQEAGDPLLLGL